MAVSVSQLGAASGGSRPRHPKENRTTWFADTTEWCSSEGIGKWVYIMLNEKEVGIFHIPWTTLLRVCAREIKESSRRVVEKYGALSWKRRMARSVRSGERCFPREQFEETFERSATFSSGARSQLIYELKEPPQRTKASVPLLKQSSSSDCDAVQFHSQVEITVIVTHVFTLGPVDPR